MVQTMASDDNGKSSEVTRTTKRVFYDKDGKPSPRVTPDTVRGTMTFKNGATIDMDFVALSEKFHPVIWQGACWGIMTNVGNAAGGLGKDDPQAAFYAAKQRWLTFFEDGSWTAERESGPRVGDIVKALGRVHAARHGVEPDQAWLDRMREKVIISPDAYRSNDRVKAELDAIKAEQMAEEAKKSAAKAADGDSELDDLLSVA